MYTPHYQLGSFEAIPTLAKGQIIRALLHGLCASNLAWLAFEPTPPLYQSGVRYHHDPDGRLEHWTDIPETLRRGVGACADLTAWRMAELLAAGDRSHDWHVTVDDVRTPSGRIVTTYHVCLRRPDPHGELVDRSGRRWGLEDPSRRLGMP